MKEDTRAVVLATRAEDILWVVGGAMHSELHNKKPRKLVVDLYRDCALKDRVHAVTPPAYQVPVPSTFQRVGV